MLAIALDTETTGLLMPCCFHDDLQPRIIEIAAVLFDLESGDIVDEINEFVNPYTSIPRKIQSITGITNADVENAPGWVDLLGALEMIAQQSPHIIAHNAAFDRDVIEYNCQMFGRPNPLLNSKWSCTQVESQWMESKPIKMSVAYGHLFGDDLAQTHRAREDVDALMKIAISLYEMGGLIHDG